MQNICLRLEIDYETFLNVDSDLLSTEIMSDEQIIESIVNENKKLSIEEELDEIENENSINSAVSYSDALGCLNKLKDYLMGPVSKQLILSAFCQK